MFRKLTELFEIQVAQAQGAASEGDCEHALQLATAALLLEMTRADHQVRPVEQVAVREALGGAFALNAREVAELEALAQAEVREATSLYDFTTLINKNLDDDRKAQLVEMLWRVAYADGELDKYEEHLVRRVAELIYVPHARFIQAKHRAQQAVAGSE
ncbi:MAG: TerB family tellurite resistance protein [Gammaproteobacteria bacterium]